MLLLAPGPVVDPQHAHPFVRVVQAGRRRDSTQDRVVARHDTEVPEEAGAAATTRGVSDPTHQLRQPQCRPAPRRCDTRQLLRESPPRTPCVPAAEAADLQEELDPAPKPGARLSARAGSDRDGSPTSTRSPDTADVVCIDRELEWRGRSDVRSTLSRTSRVGAGSVSFSASAACPIAYA